MRLRTFLAHLVVCWAWVPPSLHHRTPHAVRKPLKAENDYLAQLAKAPPKRGPGRLRRAWRRLRGAPAALSSVAPISSSQSLVCRNSQTLLWRAQTVQSTTQ